MIPFSVLPLAIYSILTVVFGVALDGSIAKVFLPSNVDVTTTVGDALVWSAWAAFAVETWRCSNARNRTMINHVLSLAIALAALGLFLFSTPFGTPVFLHMVSIMFIDVVLGAMLSITLARGNIWIENR